MLCFGACMQCYRCLFYICCVDGDDYMSPSPLLMFESDQNSVSFQFVPICDQTMNEGNENATLQISIQEQDQNLITTGQPSITNVLIIGENY